MLISMHSRTRMHSIMTPRLRAPVPSVFFILLGHCVFVPTVLLIFLWRLFLFAAGCGMMLMVMACPLRAKSGHGKTGKFAQ
jgi:hypothetical protein